MLNELVKRLGAGKSDRRGAARVRKRYEMAWEREGALVPGVGLEISEKGLLFATREAPAGARVDVAIDLHGHRLRARVKVARHGVIERDGVHWELIAAVYEGIAADDWDEIVRFCKNRPAPRNRGAEELAQRAGADDDAYRLLPLRVQERVVAALVAAGRLNPHADAKNPLLRMSYAGTFKGGSLRLDVTSRRVTDDEVLQFDSSVLIDDAGHVHLER
jgi:hypothetical protein